MSHIVKDPALPDGSVPPRCVLFNKLQCRVNLFADSDRNVSEDKFADWVDDVYRGG